MTAVTIKKGMSICEGEKEMIKIRFCPGKSIHRMAFNTIGGYVSQDMVRIACRGIILLVTIETFSSQGFKLEKGGRWVAIHTISH